MPPLPGNQPFNSGSFWDKNRQERALVQRLPTSLVVTAHIARTVAAINPSRLKESKANCCWNHNCKSPAIKTISAGAPQSSQNRNVWQPSNQPKAASQKAGCRASGGAFKPASRRNAISPPTNATGQISPPDGFNSPTSVSCTVCIPTAFRASSIACKMLARGCPVSAEPIHVPATQLMPSKTNQRNWRARKNAASGNTHKYQTPCRKTASANNGVSQKQYHHGGGVSPCRCHTSKMTPSAVTLNKNGRPSRKREVRSEISTTKTNAASHASGRLKQAAMAP